MGDNTAMHVDLPCESAEIAHDIESKLCAVPSFVASTTNSQDAIHFVYLNMVVNPSCANEQRAHSFDTYCGVSVVDDTHFSTEPHVYNDWIESQIVAVVIGATQQDTGPIGAPHGLVFVSTAPKRRECKVAPAVVELLVTRDVILQIVRADVMQVN